MGVTHAKVVNKPDVPGYDVLFSDWDAGHVVNLTASDVGADPEGSAATAQSAAQDYADGLASNYDPAGSAADAQAASWPATTPFDATVPTTQAFGDAAAAGSATKSAHRDHLHGMPAAPSAASVGADVAGAAAGAQAAAESYADSLAPNYDPAGAAAAITAASLGAMTSPQVLARGLGC